MAVTFTAMSIGTRILKKRKELGLSRSQLALAIGVSTVTIGNWEVRSGAPTGENLVKLAKRLKTTPEYITSGKTSPQTIAKRNSHGMLLPIVSLSTAAQRITSGQLNIGEAEDWRTTVANVSESSFVIRPCGDTMLNPLGSPPITTQAFAIVDPSAIAEDGNIILVTFADSDKATLKQLVLDGPHRYLKSLNPEYKTIELDENCTIIGAVKRIEYDV